MAAIPRADGGGVLPADLPGDVPDPASPPSGCRFHPRCPVARDDCAVIEQQLVTVSGRQVACQVRPRCPGGAAMSGERWESPRYVAGQRARRRRAGRRRCCPRRAVETARPDGTIAQVTASAPPGLPDEQVTDVAGRWLLPGLISCHTHLSVVFPFSDTDEAENPALTAYRSAARAAAALQAGITTIRCVHEQNRADLLLRTAAGRGWISAPRILGAGRAVSVRGGHGAGLRLRVRRRRGRVLRGRAGRAGGGRRPREDLHQRRPGQRGRAGRAPGDDRRRDPRRGARRRSARHLRRRPLR